MAVIAVWSSYDSLRDGTIHCASFVRSAGLPVFGCRGGSSTHFKLEVVPRVKTFEDLKDIRVFFSVLSSVTQETRQILSSAALHCKYFFFYGIAKNEAKDEKYIVSTVWCQGPHCKAERDALLGEYCQTWTIWHALYPDLTAPLHTITGFPH